MDKGHERDQGIGDGLLDRVLVVLATKVAKREFCTGDDRRHKLGDKDAVPTGAGCWTSSRANHNENLLRPPHSQERLLWGGVEAVEAAVLEDGENREIGRGSDLATAKRVYMIYCLADVPFFSTWAVLAIDEACW